MRCALADAQGLTFVHPFDDPLVIAGQGTIGLEMLRAQPAARHAGRSRWAAAGSSAASPPRRAR